MNREDFESMYMCNFRDNGELEKIGEEYRERVRAFDENVLGTRSMPWFGREKCLCERHAYTVGARLWCRASDLGCSRRDFLAAIYER